MRCSLLATLAFLMVATPSVAATPEPLPPPKRPCVPLAPGEVVRVDLRDAPLRDVARLVSCALERNLLFSPPTLGQKTVTVIGPRPVGARGLAVLWRALLAEHGLEASRRGGYEVVRSAQ